MLYLLMTIVFYALLFLLYLSVDIESIYSVVPNPLNKEYEVAGCMEPNALNYNRWANERSSCIRPYPACNRSWAYNYTALSNDDNGTCESPMRALKRLFVFMNVANTIIKVDGQYVAISNQQPLRYSMGLGRTGGELVVSGSNKMGEKRLEIAAPGVAQRNYLYSSLALNSLNQVEIYYPVIVWRSYGAIMNNKFTLQKVDRVAARFITDISGTVALTASIIPRFAAETLSMGKKFFFVENAQELYHLEDERRFNAQLQLLQLEDFYVNSYTNNISAQGEVVGNPETFSCYSIEATYYTNSQMYEYPDKLVMLFPLRDFRGQPMVFAPGHYSLDTPIESLRVPPYHTLVVFSRYSFPESLTTDMFSARHMHRGAQFRSFTALEEPLEVRRLPMDIYAIYVLNIEYGITLFSEENLKGLAYNLGYGYYQLRETPSYAPFVVKSMRIRLPNVLVRLFSDVLFKQQIYKFGALLQSESYNLNKLTYSGSPRLSSAIIIDQFYDNVMVLNGTYRSEVIDYGVDVVENSAITATERIIVNESKEELVRMFLLGVGDINFEGIVQAGGYFLVSIDGQMEEYKVLGDLPKLRRTLQQETGMLNLVIKGMVQSALFQKGSIQNKVSTQRLAFTLRHFSWNFLDPTGAYLGHVKADRFNLIAKLYNSPPSLASITYEADRVVLFDSKKNILAIIRDRAHPIFGEFQKVSTDFLIDYLEYTLQTKELIIWLKEPVQPFAVQKNSEM